MAVKTSLYFGDIDEGMSVSDTDCYTVQNLDYRYNHTQSSSGVAVGSATQKAELSFTIKSQSEDTSRKLYKQLLEGYVVSFSFMFDAEKVVNSDRTKYMSFKDAMVVSGYLTSIDEHFASSSYLAAYPDALKDCVTTLAAGFLGANELSLSGQEVTYSDAMAVKVTLVVHSISYLSRVKTGTDSAADSNVLLQLK